MAILRFPFDCLILLSWILCPLDSGSSFSIFFFFILVSVSSSIFLRKNMQKDILTYYIIKFLVLAGLKLFSFYFKVDW